VKKNESKISSSHSTDRAAEKVKRGSSLPVSNLGDRVNFRNCEEDEKLNEAKSKQFIKKRKKHNHPNLKQMKNLAKLRIHAEKCEACRVEYKMMKNEMLPPLPKNIHCSYNFDLIQGQILEVKNLIASRSEENWAKA
jgi:hypothetical protein